MKKNNNSKIAGCYVDVNRLWHVPGNLFSLSSAEWRARHGRRAMDAFHGQIIHHYICRCTRILARRCLIGTCQHSAGVAFVWNVPAVYVCACEWVSQSETDKAVDKQKIFGAAATARHIQRATRSNLNTILHMRPIDFSVSGTHTHTISGDARRDEPNENHCDRERERESAKVKNGNWHHALTEHRESNDTFAVMPELSRHSIVVRSRQNAKIEIFYFHLENMKFNSSTTTTTCRK